MLFRLIPTLLSVLGIDITDGERLRFARLASTATAIYAGATVLGVLTSVLLARLLGPQGLGIYGPAFALASFVVVLTNTGVPTIVILLLSTYLQHGDCASARGCMRWAYTHVFLLALAASGVVAVVLMQTGWVGQALSTYLVALAIVPLWGLIAVQAGVLQGIERTAEARSPDLLIRPGTLTLMLAGMLICGTSQSQPTTAMTLQWIAFALASLVGAFFVRRTTTPRFGKGVRSFRLKSWYRPCPSLTVTEVSEVVMAQCTLMILPAFVEPAEVGLFRAALVASMLTTLPATAVNLPLPPLIARLFVKRELHDLQSLVTMSARIGLVTCLPIGLCFVIIGKMVLEMLFGIEFGAAYPMLFVLTIGQLASVLAGPANWLLRMTGHERREAQAVGCAAAAQVILTLALAHRFGSLGAATAHSACQILFNVLLLIQVIRRLRADSTFIGVPKRVSTPRRPPNPKDARR